jgi:HlyD family secretion protein/epimerase transport system membrane fusion protein
MDHTLVVQPSRNSLIVLPKNPGWEQQASLKRVTRGPARYGLLIIIVFVSALTVWGAWVPLAGGAMAPGIVTPDQGQKTIQHLEGGIIAELKAHDGDVVKQGQPLVVLEDVQARATHDALQQQKWSLLAKQARLNAESEGKSQIEWPAELKRSTPQIDAILAAQQKVFDTRKEELTTKKGVLTRRIAQLTDQIGGINLQVESSSNQLALIAEELEGKKKLLSIGLLPKPEYLRLKRNAVEIEGRRGEYLAEISRAQQQIGETKMQILAAEAERATQIANDSDQTRLQLGEVIEKLRGNDDVLKRSVVTAPISGTVISSKFKTIGGVIGKGESIMQIVPANDSLVIDARVTPLDVKSVRKGLSAEIRFPAYSSRTTPRIPGDVQSVSADRILDQYSHEPYYLARVAVSRDLLKQIAPDVKLVPGMPAEVLIITEHHTMFHYLFKPFLDIFRNSFHET